VSAECLVLFLLWLASYGLSTAAWIGWRRAARTWRRVAEELQRREDRRR